MLSTSLLNGWDGRHIYCLLVKKKVYDAFELIQDKDPDCRALEDLVDNAHPDPRWRFDAARVLSVYEKLFRQHNRKLGSHVSLGLTSAFHADLFYENEDEFAPIVAEKMRSNKLVVVTYAHASGDLIALAKRDEWKFKRELFLLAADYARLAYRLDEGSQTTAGLVWAFGELARSTDNKDAEQLFTEAVVAFEKGGDASQLTHASRLNIRRCYQELGALTGNKDYLEKAEMLLRNALPPATSRNARYSDHPF